MFGLGPWELILILVVALFIFGGKRLPQLGEGIGRSITEFKRAIRDTRPSDGQSADSPHKPAGKEEMRE